VATFEFDKSDPTARMPGESERANMALIDYVVMGPARTLAKLMAEYRAQAATGRQPPTTRIATIKSWSSKYRWQARLAIIIAAEKDAALTDYAERQAAFRDRAWRDHEKVGELFDKIMDRAPAYLDTRVVKQGRPALKDAKGNIVDRGEARVVTTRLNTADAVRLRKLGLDLGETGAAVESKEPPGGEVILKVVWERADRTDDNST